MNALTEREREILVAIGKGRTNGEIAAPIRAVRVHREDPCRRVPAKTGARGTIQAVILAYDLGLCPPRIRPGPPAPPAFAVAVVYVVSVSVSATVTVTVTEKSLSTV